MTADSVYYCSIAKRVPNTNALGAGDYGSAALSQAWDSVVAWAKTDKGQKILMTALSVAEVAGGIAITAATGGSAGLLIAAVGAGLVGGGASSLIGGYLTEKIGGDFKTGWISGQISGAITGAGIGAGSLGFSSVALDIGASAKQVLGGTTILVGSSGLAGFIGGTLSSTYTQWSSNQELDVNAALKNGITSGSISALSWPFSAVASALGSADASITSTIVSLIEEGIFDVSGSYVGAAAEVTK